MPRARQSKRRRWIWPVLIGAGALVALVLLGFGGLFDRAGTDLPRAGAAAPPLAGTAAPSEPVSVAAAPGGTGAAGQERAPSAAVILKDESNVPAVAAAASSPAPAPASAASRPAPADNELSRIFSPPAPVAARRAAAARAAPQDSTDSDVDLLTMLMKHVEAAADTPASTTAKPRPAKGARKGTQPKSVAIPATGSVELALKSCPAANTEAGIACRQRICAAHQGQSPSCPRSSPDL